MKVHVNVATDISLGVAPHNVAPPPQELPSVEGACEHAWPPGEGEGKHRMSRSVKHGGRRLVQQDHDCGPGIPHQTAPGDMLLPTTMASSERKMLFGASTVVAEGKPIACGDITAGLLMTTCSSWGSLPVGMPVTNLERTVLVGATGADRRRGWIALAQERLVDIVVERIQEAIQKELGVPFDVPDWLQPPPLRLAKEALGAYLEICFSMITHGLTGGETPIRGDLEVPWGGPTVEIQVRPGEGLEVVVTQSSDDVEVRHVVDGEGGRSEGETHGPPHDAEARGWTREGGYSR